ncbi:MAG: hypothetical protein ACRDE7_10145 [Sphingobacterium sp.]
MAHIESILISIAFFVTTLMLVVAILNFILKNRLIQTGQTDPEVLKMLSITFDQKTATLKWGTILLLGGIGLVTIHYLPDARDLESPLPYGIETIFLAVGFLLYYLMVKKSSTKG